MAFMKQIFNTLNTLPHSPARTGILHTRHGEVPTPVFCPVGSQASVKTLAPEEIKAAGANMILANTYHLYLRPGIETVRSMGGLHRFMGWDRPILTDSGGFQLFSLAPLVKITEEGVVFRSHIDGSRHFITPEDAVYFQQDLGTDIMMVLDDVPPHDAPPDKISVAVERTSRWAERCLAARNSPDQMLFAIVQGGISPEMRRQSADQLAQLDFDGFAIGGLSLGEAKLDTWQTVEATVPRLPEDRPRYLMGVGSPEDLIEGISRGIDIFDSVLPTRVARNGGLYTQSGRINIKNSRMKLLDAPVEKDCNCYTCQTFSAAYLAHLFRSGEVLGLRLATIHNVSFIQRLVNKARQAILDGTFNLFKEGFLEGYRPSDEVKRNEQKQKWLRRNRLQD